MILDSIINLFYLLGAIAFVIGLRRLSSPDTARRGNILAGIGMGLAIIAALASHFFETKETGEEVLIDAPNNYVWIAAGMIVGAIIGWFAAKKVKMTAMPQMVSVFNGLGGACAAVLATVEIIHLDAGTTTMDHGQLLIVLFAMLVGGISFSGSMLAYGKLEGIVNDRKVTLPGHHIINMVILVATLVIGVILMIQGENAGLILGIIFLGLAILYGFSFVAPIGGADMPVVISLLNSFTGLSAAAAGLIYDNKFMLVGGILVGAAGTILTVLMCQAMNRSLLNVLIGGLSGGTMSAAVGAGEVVIKEATTNDTAILLYYSKSAVIVPGYGLAVAQAQKTCKDLQDLLESNGVDVRYAIHPVAGRMPGHMNVLLAEADVPYPNLLDLDDANEALKNADVVLVVGANDVVNPAALDDPSSPIYGMPILRVWDAKHVIVMKRSMRTGYAGIDNPLFFHKKTQMLFGDAKESIQKLIQAVKEL